MQPNFKTMSSTELKHYALAHRDEVEPLQELYRRRTPDTETTWFTLPTNQEETEKQSALFQQMINDRSAHFSTHNNISPTITNTINQLRSMSTPEAPQLADLLNQLKTTIETSSLSTEDKTEALEYVQEIGTLATKDTKPDPKGIKKALNALQFVMSKVANLVPNVTTIVEGIRALFPG